MFTTEIIQLNSNFPENFKEIPKEFINNSTDFIINNYDGNLNILRNLYDDLDPNSKIIYYFGFAIFDGLPNENYDNIIRELTNEPLEFIMGQKYQLSTIINDEEKFILNSNPNYKLIIYI